MRPVPVDNVRRLAQAHGARGCVVLSLSDDKYAVTSYGRSKKDCRDMQAFVDALLKPLDEGDLAPWRVK
ncbi:hypothetical protein LCGC14_1243350 [marine sediment metagenome]|uniref:Uncharacterized protein n=1 Tax=marine sediment metagenome TaxID=412755 RepID=A0A0F9L557_9ZZZZ